MAALRLNCQSLANGPKLTFMDARMLRRGFARTDIRICLPHGPERVSLRVAKVASFDWTYLSYGLSSVIFLSRSAT